MTVSRIKPQTFSAFVFKYGLFYISVGATILILLLSVVPLVIGVYFGWIAFIFSLLLLPAALIAQLRLRFSSWPDTPIDTSRAISFQSVFLSRQLLLNQDTISEMFENELRWSISWKNLARFSFFPGNKYSSAHFYFASSLNNKEIRINAIGYSPDPQFVAEAVRLFWQANKTKG